MQEKGRFSITALVLILLFVAALMGIIYYLIPDAVMSQAPIIFGAAAGVALLLWLVLQWLAGRAMDGAAQAALAARPPVTMPAPPVMAPAPEPVTEPEPAPKPTPAAPAPEPDETPAIQMLAILQRKGRLIDFLQEDLSPYADDQVGAAVRTIHEGCRDALKETVVLEPIFQGVEGEMVTIEDGFDANAVRLVGNLAGAPPFNGVLRHRGWRVNKIDLPQRLQGGSKEMIVAPAEVEVQG